jgi:hypothetical protein
VYGIDGRYPYDTGEYNLSGFAGNARAFGSFTITLPIPSEVDPDNASVPYRTFGRSCRNR